MAHVIDPSAGVALNEEELQEILLRPYMNPEY